MRLPFTEYEIEGNTILREFNKETDSEELSWHRDQEDRIISSISESDWMFQLENCIPIRITESIYVPAGTWHRLIKGSGDLTLKIIKRNG